MEIVFFFSYPEYKQPLFELNPTLFPFFPIFCHPVKPAPLDISSVQQDWQEVPPPVRSPVTRTFTRGYVCLRDMINFTARSTKNCRTQKIYCLERFQSKTEEGCVNI